METGSDLTAEMPLKLLIFRTFGVDGQAVRSLGGKSHGERSIPPIPSPFPLQLHLTDLPDLTYYFYNRKKY